MHVAIRSLGPTFILLEDMTKQVLGLHTSTQFFATSTDDQKY